MTEKACVKCLQKEYRALCKEPVSHVVARPLPNDILEWHKFLPLLILFYLCSCVLNLLSFSQSDYVLEGSEGTPFAGSGCYFTFRACSTMHRARMPVHGCPLHNSACVHTQRWVYYGKIKFPPEYPFKPPGISMITPNGRFITQNKICLSMSDFHPESWNPMWSVSSILTGLLSFMVCLMMDTSPTTGRVTTTAEDKRRLVKSSLEFNCKNQTFKKLFPEYVVKYEEQLAAQQSVEQASPSYELLTSSLICLNL